MGNMFGPGGGIIDMNQGGQGGPRAGYMWGQQQPTAPLNADPTSGPQLAPGQSYVGQTLPSPATPETDAQRQKRLAKPVNTILGDPAGTTDTLG